MSMMQALLAITGLCTLAVAACYSTLTLVAVVLWRQRKAPSPGVELPAITMLKPLCGDEPGLYANLRSFCEQDYPQFQLIFGVCDADDPALGVAARLQAEFPSLPIDVVISQQQHGSNRKISNLINMLAAARHDVLVAADSDTFVRPDYLAAVTAPLLGADVGLVTCVHRDVPTPRLWSRLGAMYVNEWFIPSVLLAWLFGHRSYASGQTLCLRRNTLQAIGGLASIGNHLADDYRLGELVHSLGQRIVLSPYALNTEHDERSLSLLTRHELRWMRTLRVLRPRSFRLLFLSFSLPLAIFGALLMPAQSALARLGWILFLTTVIARLALYILQRLGEARSLLADLWLLPIRDLLILWIWCRSFFSSRLTWRNTEFEVGTDGIMRQGHERSA